MAPPQVKTPTEWPCENAAVGEVVECPGTDAQNRVCRKLVQIRAGTTPDKPSFGKYFIMHPTDDGGCGYFSYVVFKEGETKIGLEEPVYRRAKRKIATSEIPSADIDPTESKKAKVEHAGFQEQLDSLREFICTLTPKVEGTQAQMTSLEDQLNDVKQDVSNLTTHVHEELKLLIARIGCVKAPCTGAVAIVPE